MAIGGRLCCGTLRRPRRPRALGRRTLTPRLGVRHYGSISKRYYQGLHQSPPSANVGPCKELHDELFSTFPTPARFEITGPHRSP